METEETFNIGLSLQLGPTEFVQRHHRCRERPVKFHQLFPPQTKEEVLHEDHHMDLLSSKREMEIMNNTNNSDHTSYSNCSNDDNSSRKKLRLTKEQSVLLEESFKKHSTLNSTQKEDLARRLSLKPRQVEVWFQNRRARTKMKQTEVDYEFLKKYCESLRDENRRLKTELQELRSTKPKSSPFYMQYAKAATLTMCSSCNENRKVPNETNSTVIDVNGKPDKSCGDCDESALTC